MKCIIEGIGALVNEKGNKQPLKAGDFAQVNPDEKHQQTVTVAMIFHTDINWSLFLILTSTDKGDYTTIGHRDTRGDMSPKVAMENAMH